MNTKKNIALQINMGLNSRQSEIFNYVAKEMGLNKTACTKVLFYEKYEELKTPKGGIKMLANMVAEIIMNNKKE